MRTCQEIWKEILQFLEGNFVKKDEKKKFGCERVEALEGQFWENPSLFPGIRLLIHFRFDI